MRCSSLFFAFILASAFLNAAESNVPPIPSGGDAYENWLLRIIRQIHEVIPGMSRVNVEHILATQRGLAGTDQFYHFPGYPQIQVKVRYHTDLGGNRQKDVVEKVDPPFLVDVPPQQRQTE